MQISITTAEKEIISIYRPSNKRKMKTLWVFCTFLALSSGYRWSVLDDRSNVCNNNVCGSRPHSACLPVQFFVEWCAYINLDTIRNRCFCFVTHRWRQPKRAKISNGSQSGRSSNTFYSVIMDYGIVWQKPKTKRYRIWITSIGTTS